MQTRTRHFLILASIAISVACVVCFLTYSRSTWKLLASLDGVGGDVKFSPDGKSFVARTGEHLPELAEWDIATRERQRDFSGDLCVLRYDPQGLSMLRRSVNSIEILDAGRLPPLANFQTQFGATTGGLVPGGFQLTPDRSTFVLGQENGMLTFFDLRSPARPATLQTDHANVTCIALSHDGRTLAMGGWLASGGQRRAVCLIDVTERKIRTTVLMRREPECLAFAADDKMLAVGYGGLRYTFLVGLTQGAGSPDSCFGRVLLCDVNTGKEVATVGDQTHWVSSVAFSPDGTLLAAGGSGGPAAAPHVVMVWNIPTQAKVATLYGHSGDIDGVCFSPDGTLLATTSSGWDGSSKVITKLWKVPPSNQFP